MDDEDLKFVLTIDPDVKAVEDALAQLAASSAKTGSLAGSSISKSLTSASKLAANQSSAALESITRELADQLALMDKMRQSQGVTSPQQATSVGTTVKVAGIDKLQDQLDELTATTAALNKSGVQLPVASTSASVKQLDELTSAYKSAYDVSVRLQKVMTDPQVASGNSEIEVLAKRRAMVKQVADEVERQRASLSASNPLLATMAKLQWEVTKASKQVDRSVEASVLRDVNGELDKQRSKLAALKEAADPRMVEKRLQLEIEIGHVKEQQRRVEQGISEAIQDGMDRAANGAASLRDAEAALAAMRAGGAPDRELGRGVGGHGGQLTGPAPAAGRPNDVQVQRDGGSGVLSGLGGVLSGFLGSLTGVVRGQQPPGPQVVNNVTNVENVVSQRQHPVLAQPPQQHTRGQFGQPQQVLPPQPTAVPRQPVVAPPTQAAAPQHPTAAAPAQHAPPTGGGGGVGKAAAGITATFAALEAGLSSLQGQTGPVAGGLSVLAGGINMLADKAKAAPVIGAALGAIGESIGALVGGLAGVAGLIVSFASVASPGQFTQFTAAVQDVVGVIGQTLLPVLTMLMEGVRLFGDILATILPNTEQMTEALQPLREAFATIGQAIREMFQEIGPTIRAVFIGAVQLLGEVMKVVAPLIVAVARAITWLLSPLTQLIGTTNALSSSVGAAARAAHISSFDSYQQQLQLAAFSSASGQPTQAQVPSILTGISSLISSIWNWVRNFTLIGALGQLYDVIRRAVNPANWGTQAAAVGGGSQVGWDQPDAGAIGSVGGADADDANNATGWQQP